MARNPKRPGFCRCLLCNYQTFGDRMALVIVVLAGKDGHAVRRLRWVCRVCADRPHPAIVAVQCEYKPWPILGDAEGVLHGK